MKKQYKAMGALALATAFIAINGVIADASPLGTNNYYVGADVHTGSNAAHDNTTGGNEIPRTTDDTHGEWVIVKEPTYTEDGLRKRGYTSDDGVFHVEFESIQRLMPTPVLPVVPPQPEPSQPGPSLPEESQPSRPTDNSSKFENNKHHGSSKKKRNVESANNNGDAKTLSDKTLPSESKASTQQSVVGTVNTLSDADNKKIEKNSEGNTGKSKISERRAENTVSQKESGNMETKAPDSKVDVSEKTDELRVTESAAADKIKVAQKQDKNNTKAVGKKVDATPVQAESAKASRSFNGYDGVTIFAAGAYTWWISIVLLPMIDAFKWINKKRREKSRGNVNKKHN
ncbi:MAG: hypothetical protein KH260_07155 [Lachnospiraceae bacterium oral taxon 082]|nr:hypothetical protein [Lachnospiraceae bacterium oral taxon 082]